jgi:hypothetical protein
MSFLLRLLHVHPCYACCMYFLLRLLHVLPVTPLACPSCYASCMSFLLRLLHVLPAMPLTPPFCYASCTSFLLRANRTAMLHLPLLCLLHISHSTPAPPSNSLLQIASCKSDSEVHPYLLCLLYLSHSIPAPPYYASCNYTILLCLLHIFQCYAFFFFF